MQRFWFSRAEALRPGFWAPRLARLSRNLLGSTQHSDVYPWHGICRAYCIDSSAELEQPCSYCVCPAALLTLWVPLA